MYLNQNLKFRKIKGFKNRGLLKRTSIVLTNNLFYWERKKSYIIFNKNNSYVELNFLRFIFFKFRRCFVRKKYFLTLHIAPNYMFSKKSKNARMGKGVGSFKRPVRSVKMHQPLIYSTMFSIKRFLRLRKVLLAKKPGSFL